MKRKCYLAIFLFFLFISFVPTTVEAHAFQTQKFLIKENLEFLINFGDRKICYHTSELLKNKKLSKIQQQLIENESKRIEKLQSIKNLGVSENEALYFLYPEAEELYKLMQNSFSKSAEDNHILVNKNKCEIVFLEGKQGQFVDGLNFAGEILKSLKEGNKKIKIDLKTKEYSSKNILKEDYREKGCFSTNFSTSSESRKNNIKRALSSFDGIVLDEGEILSFNETTGKRTEENGYQKAKIITAGTFVDGYGGGVCQVSTTLYNACLLAGLEIIEVNSHSLPVSYVEPSFDAMVNSGSSDLVIRNNTNGKIVITSSSENDKCKFKIFGKENECKITRISEKTKIIPAKEEKYDSDYQKYGLELEIGEEKRLSFAKDGYYSNGYLNYYDKKGNLVKTQKIRESKYYPTEGIVAIREN